MATQRHNRGMDAHAILGIPPGASAEEATEAYRRLATRWHPDRAGAGAGARMAQINAAYDALRLEPPARDMPHAPTARGHGAWLAAPIRRALGAELVGALVADEYVHLVTPASTWASPNTVLAVTDRRLLWLLDDLPTHRVRYVRFGAIADVEHRLSWPRRRRATLRVRPDYGRRWTFAELSPGTAAAIAAVLTGRGSA